MHALLWQVRGEFHLLDWRWNLMEAGWLAAATPPCGSPCSPCTNAAAYAPVSSGSSPGISWLRPQRGSIARLTLGVQYDRPSP